MDIDDDYHEIANAQPAQLTVKDVALQIFVHKYSFHLLGGAMEWLQELADHFEISDVNDATDTFEHIAAACRGAAGTSFHFVFLKRGRKQRNGEADVGTRALDGPTVISVELLETTYEKLLLASAGDGDDDAGVKEFDTNHVLKVVDAFDMPAWRWAEDSKTFEK